jgi:hypothetical protein
MLKTFFPLPCLQKKISEFLDWLTNCHLLKKDSATRSYLSINAGRATLPASC